MFVIRDAIIPIPHCDATDFFGAGFIFDIVSRVACEDFVCAVGPFGSVPYSAFGGASAIWDGVGGINGKCTFRIIIIIFGASYPCGGARYGPVVCGAIQCGRFWDVGVGVAIV